MLQIYFPPPAPTLSMPAFGLTYQVANSTDTTIANTANYYAVAGTSSAGAMLDVHSASSNHITIDRAGYYMISATASLTSATEQLLHFAVAKNGSVISGVLASVTTINPLIGNARHENLAVSCAVFCTVGDIIGLRIRNTTSTAAVKVINNNLVVAKINPY